jgi:hypothetical protein
MYHLEWEYHSCHGRRRIHERASSKNCHEEIEDLSYLVIASTISEVHNQKYVPRFSIVTTKTYPQRFQF